MLNNRTVNFNMHGPAKVTSVVDFVADTIAKPSVPIRSIFVYPHENGKHDPSIFDGCQCLADKIALAVSGHGINGNRFVTDRFVSQLNIGYELEYSTDDAGRICLHSKEVIREVSDDLRVITANSHIGDIYIEGRAMFDAVLIPANQQGRDIQLLAQDVKASVVHVPHRLTYVTAFNIHDSENGSWLFAYRYSENLFGAGLYTNHLKKRQDSSDSKLTVSQIEKAAITVFPNLDTIHYAVSRLQLRQANRIFLGAKEHNQAIRSFDANAYIKARKMFKKLCMRPDVLTEECLARVLPEFDDGSDEFAYLQAGMELFTCRTPTPYLF